MDEQTLENELERRCAAAGLTVKEETEEFEETDGTRYRQVHGWVISSTGQDFSGKILLQHHGDIEFALTTKFEEFRPIPGHEGMWSLDGGTIEAELILHPTLFEYEHAFASLLGRLDLYKHDQDPKSVMISFPRGAADPAVTLRFASPELLIWRTTSPAVHLINRDALIPCIRIEGLHLRSESEAKDRLVSISNGALLEVERQTDVAARLRTHYPWKISFDDQRSKATLHHVDSTPEVIPMGLYMHARLETSNLAAQFLGFYQVLEYFFPRYSNPALVRKLGEAITDALPSLGGALSEAQLRRILERTQLNRGRGADSEVEQLKRILKAIVNPPELRHFFIDKNFHQFYSSPDAPIVEERIMVEDSSRDLRDDTAQRLYKIRCRIVHAKADPDDDVFIPFAAEVAELEPDVQLIRFLSQRALWHSARPLR